MTYNVGSVNRVNGPRLLTTISERVLTMAAEDSTPFPYKNSYYAKVRRDPEFLRKRKEYAAARWKSIRERAMERARQWAKDNPERTKEIGRAARDRKQLLYIYRNIRKRAKRQGREFSIEYSDIIIPDVCPIFGVPFTMNATADNCDFAPSIDRIDSSKGYVKGNIQVISKLANCMKWTATKEQLLAFANGVIKLYS